MLHNGKCCKVLKLRIERQFLHAARVVVEQINVYRSLVGKL